MRLTADGLQPERSPASRWTSKNVAFLVVVAVVQRSRDVEVGLVVLVVVVFRFESPPSWQCQGQPRF